MKSSLSAVVSLLSHRVLHPDGLTPGSVRVLDDFLERPGMRLGADDDRTAPLDDPHLGRRYALERPPESLYMLQT